MLQEQLLHEQPGIFADHPGWTALDDADLCLLSEGLHRAALVHPQADRAYHWERIGESFHIRRNLGEAARWYRQVLDLEPPRPPSEAERRAILRHAPLLLTNPREFFPLKDVAAFHHPEHPLIAYHLFWEDDYNFPDDLEPCDHEQLWVAYDPGTGLATGVRSFFHSQILGSPEAVAEANAHGGRPLVRVEWGLHGSLVAGWETLQFDSGGSPESWLDHNFRGVKTGGRAKDHPLKRRWPACFDGTWNDYLDFSAPVDSLTLLEEKELLLTGRWANALIQQCCLPYNFAVKYDWPFGLVPHG